MEFIDNFLWTYFSFAETIRNHSFGKIHQHNLSAAAKPIYQFDTRPKIRTENVMLIVMIELRDRMIRLPPAAQSEC